MHAERDAAAARRRLLAPLACLLLIGACGDDPADPDPACIDAAILQSGITRDSVLSPGDPVLDGSFINYYAVLPDVPGTLVVEMAAELSANPATPGVDPFLYLWTEQLGDPEAQAYDPSGAGPLLRVARLAVDVAPGCYRIGASGWPQHAQGAYTIRADLIPAS